MNRPMTAAEYKAHAEKVRAGEGTYTVPLKSGATFELRKLDLQEYVLLGRIPQSLLNEGLKAWKKQGVGSGVKQSDLSDEETVNSLVFMREVVQGCCINPRLVEYVIHDAHCKSCPWEGQVAELTIVEDPNNGPRTYLCPKCSNAEFVWELGAASMLKQDFLEIFNWAMSHQGVAGIDGLQSFRKGRERGTPATRPNSKRQRRKDKRTLETVESVQ